jgi:hypothetical protein
MPVALQGSTALASRDDVQRVLDVILEPADAQTASAPHPTLSRYFARPQVIEQLKRAEQLERTKQRAVEAR